MHDAFVKRTSRWISRYGLDGSLLTRVQNALNDVNDVTELEALANAILKSDFGHLVTFYVIERCLPWGVAFDDEAIANVVGATEGYPRSFQGDIIIHARHPLLAYELLGGHRSLRHLMREIEKQPHLVWETDLMEAILEDLPAIPYAIAVSWPAFFEMAQNPRLHSRLRVFFSQHSEARNHERWNELAQLIDF